jgi:hypothetical protein
MSRRSYGTGSLYVRVDAAGREAWYGQWRADGQKIKRKVGPKRSEGTRDGLTALQAEAALRRLMDETVVAPRAGDERIDVAELGRRYLRYLVDRRPQAVDDRRGAWSHRALARAVLR